MSPKGTLKICEKGHKFYKSSDCPVCPVCEAEKEPENEFLSKIGAPARRALEREGLTTLEKLSEWREKEVLKLHGVGPSALPKLRTALQNQGLNFRSSQ